MTPTFPQTKALALALLVCCCLTGCDLWAPTGDWNEDSLYFDPILSQRRHSYDSETVEADISTNTTARSGAAHLPITDDDFDDPQKSNTQSRPYVAGAGHRRLDSPPEALEPSKSIIILDEYNQSLESIDRADRRALSKEEELELQKRYAQEKSDPTAKPGPAATPSTSTSDARRSQHSGSSRQEERGPSSFFARGQSSLIARWLASAKGLQGFGTSDLKTGKRLPNNLVISPYDPDKKPRSIASLKSAAPPANRKLCPVTGKPFLVPEEKRVAASAPAPGHGAAAAESVIGASGAREMNSRTSTRAAAAPALPAKESEAARSSLAPSQKIP